MTAATAKPTARRDHARPGVLELLDAAVGAVPGGAERPGQRAMAEAVARAARTGEHLLVQAGTGTGKSLAYLVPSLLVDGPVVVSTATLALQSQLVDHDLPRLAEAVRPLLGRSPTYAVLKGRHHYLCRAKLDNSAADEPGDALFDTGGGGGTKWLGEAGRMGKQVQRLRDWADETKTGDRDELDPGVDESAWRLVSMPARECVGAQRCPFGAECFAEASRARAREADIVVTNHSLLAVDMLSGRQIVPPHRLLVIDEAHELADRVSSAAQAELSPEALDRSARRARPLLPEDFHEALVEASDAADGRARRRAARPAHHRPAAGPRRRADPARPGHPPLPRPARRRQGRRPRSGTQAAGQGRPDRTVHHRPAAAGVRRARRGLDRKRRPRPPGRRGRAAVRRRYPRHPPVRGPHRRRHLGDPGPRRSVRHRGPRPRAGRHTGTPGQRRVPRVAGAAAGRGAGRRDTAGTAAWTSLDVGSPFDYARQGILYVAARLPRPTASGLSEAAADEMVALVDALGGRTLGLFSSRRAAERAAEVLRERTDHTVLVQGEEALPLLVRRFREDRDSCLLGVMSLWQGVDVPGDACQLVLIDRLPFPRPDEPLAAARSAAVDARGGSGFASVSVPIAAVRLAQGAGRLIRAAGDRGVVAVLDSRLETARGYGSFLRRSLPPFWYTTKQDVVLGALRRLAAT